MATDEESFEAAKERLAEKLERNRLAAEGKKEEAKKIMKSRIMPTGKKPPEKNKK